jgi:hypothetical protein
LPHSARKVSGVNNYLIPTQLIGEFLENFSLKLIIAPNLFASFLKDTLCSAWGLMLHK